VLALLLVLPPSKDRHGAWCAQLMTTPSVGPGTALT